MIPIFSRRNLRSAALIAFTLLLAGSLDAQELGNLIEQQQQLSAFAQIIEAAGMTDQLNNEGPFTVFAPTNQALAVAGFSGISGNAGRLRQLVRNHIITGMATARNIRMMKRIPSVGGLELIIAENQGTLTVNNVRLVETNLRASNGIVHIIDRTLDR